MLHGAATYMQHSCSSKNSRTTLLHQTKHRMSTQKCIQALMSTFIRANRALTAYPVLQGWLEHNAEDRSVLLRWGSHSSSGSRQRCSSNFSFNATERKGSSVPSIWSTWQLWWHGALPDVSGGRLAGAKVGC
jgi:hypothetical protein